MPALPDTSLAPLLRDRRVAFALTAAAAALVRGEWSESLSAHAFAPVLFLALAALAVAAFLPRRQREAFAAAAERLERRTRVVAFLMAALLLYWSVRLLFLPGAF